jgi:hypothetical protein
VAAGGLLLGASAPVRQVGEALLLPALVFALAAARGWRTRLLHSTVLTVCFAAPILGYMAYSDMVLHYGFELSNMGDAYLYGRTAHAADCATLSIPAGLRPLCPAPQVAAALGVDGLVNSPLTPRVLYLPVNAKLGQLIDTSPMQRELAYAVIRQQPLRVAGDIARDSVKVFALTRDGDAGDTPIARWQFQTSYPYYPRGITEYGRNSASGVFAATGGGGDARVFRPAATALRDYQLHGGYTPGPVLLLALLGGVAGIFAIGRRDRGNPGLACLLAAGLGVAAILGADLYEFSWRYQLPALVTLPVAGALGATAIARRVRERRTAATRAAPPGHVGELAGAVPEQGS